MGDWVIEGQKEYPAQVFMFGYGVDRRNCVGKLKRTPLTWKTEFRKNWARSGGSVVVDDLKITEYPSIKSSRFTVIDLVLFRKISF